MKNTVLVATLVTLLGLLALAGDNLTAGDRPSKVYDFVVKDIDGKEVKLDQYRGKTLLLVNVASQCGYTPQYEGLQQLYSKYQNQGLVVLGFPANDFGAQEPGSDQEIKTFCTTRYKVTFPMFSKISVKGPNKHPLYKMLTEQNTNPKFAGDIKWNFSKFLIDKNGSVVARFEPEDKPESDKVVKAVEQALQ
jgi:glutathione peroxidase